MESSSNSCTRSIVLHISGYNSYNRQRNFQRWLETHGSQLQALQLHAKASYLPTALPCPQLEDLHLHAEKTFSRRSVDDRVWDDISAATKLKSISLDNLKAARGTEEVMALLAALPNLQYIAWRSLDCCGEKFLLGVPSLQHLTKLTGLELKDVTAKAMEQLSAHTKLRHLSVDGVPPMWGFEGFPGLQQLTLLTRLHLGGATYTDNLIPLVVNRLTAVQHLGLHNASCEHIRQFHALSGLTTLSVKAVRYLSKFSLASPPQLPSLQCLELGSEYLGGMLELDSSVSDLPMSYLAGCPRLQELSLVRLVLRDPGCVLGLTSLKHTLSSSFGIPLLIAEDVERLVTWCSDLRTLELPVKDTVKLSALAQLPYLTCLSVGGHDEHLCSSVAQLTGLRQLLLCSKCELHIKDLLQLGALTQLTSMGFTDGYVRLPRALCDRMPDPLPGCSYAIVNKAPPWLPPDGSSQLLRVCNEVIALQTAPQAIEPQEIAQQLVTQQPEPHQPGWLSRLVGIVCAVLLRPLQPGAP